MDLVRDENGKNLCEFKKITVLQYGKSTNISHKTSFK